MVPIQAILTISLYDPQRENDPAGSMKACCYGEISARYENWHQATFGDDICCRRGRGYHVLR